MIKTDLVERSEDLQDDPLLSVIGIAAIIFLRDMTDTQSAMDVHVFAGEVKSADPDTNRKIGDMSLVQEKIQGRLTPQGTIIYESTEATLRRALGEVINDDNLQQNAGDNFRRVIFEHDIIVPLPSLSTPNAAGRVIFVSHTGDHSRYTPSDQRETTRSRPVPIGSLLSNKRLRDTSQTILEHVIAHDLLSQAIAHDRQGLTEPIYPPGYTFKNSSKGTDVTKLYERKDKLLKRNGR